MYSLRLRMRSSSSFGTHLPLYSRRPWSHFFLSSFLTQPSSVTQLFFRISASHFVIHFFSVLSHAYPKILRASLWLGAAAATSLLRPYARVKSPSFMHFVASKKSFFAF